MSSAASGICSRCEMTTQVPHWNATCILLLNRVLDGDLYKSEIADGPFLVGMVRSHPAIVLEVPPSAKIAWEAVFQVPSIGRQFMIFLV